MNIQETLDYVDKRISPLRSNWMMSPDEKALRLLYAEVIRLREIIEIGTRDNPDFGDYSKSAGNFMDAFIEHKQRAESAEDREASWHEKYDYLQELNVRYRAMLERIRTESTGASYAYLREIITSLLDEVE